MSDVDPDYTPVVQRLPAALAEEAEARRVEAERLAEIAAEADRKAADAWRADEEKRKKAAAAEAKKKK